MSTTTTRPATTELAAARRELAKLRDTLVRADNALVDYWRTDRWRLFGHRTWRAFVEAELPQLRALAVGDPGARDAKLVELCRDHGMTQGAAADTLGVGKATASRALEGVELPDRAKGTDGRMMPTRQAAPVRRKRRRAVPLTDRAVALLTERGPLDVRQVCRELGISRTEMAPTLTRLHDAGRIAYLAPERRGQFGRWTVAG